MQEHVIVLGGFESAYMKKLALYFNSRLDDHTRVEIIRELRDCGAQDTGMAWIGSEDFIRGIRSMKEDSSCIVLAEETSEDADHVFRYQPCERLYQKVMVRYRQMFGISAVSAVGTKQEWIVITADTAMDSLLAFSVIGAQILGERAGVLYLNLSECSGMEEAFLLERGMDLADVAAALQKEDEVCLDGCIRRLEQMDYIMPPVNPMILHELREREVRRLIQAVQQKEDYAYVVVALGSCCCGCELIFRTAARIFHLSGKGYLSDCSRKERYQFIRLCLGKQETPVEQVDAPPLPPGQGGVHLIHEWQEGMIGRAVRNCLDREVNM
ncbi:MAG: hypothetical protein LIO75_04460 [Lachnospiraceae bacterium]|nr:hypothetical protein [Lachnospiraceae bacterium]